MSSYLVSTLSCGCRVSDLVLRSSGTEWMVLTAYSLYGEEPEGMPDESVVVQSDMKSAID